MGGLIVKAVAAAGVVGGGALTAQKVAGKYGSDAKKMVDTKEGVPIKFGFTTSSEVRDCARAVCETEERETEEQGRCVRQRSGVSSPEREDHARGKSACTCMGALRLVCGRMSAVTRIDRLCRQTVSFPVTVDRE